MADHAWRNTIISCIIVSSASLLGVGAFVLMGTRTLKESKLGYLNSFAAGTLVMNALVHIIPEGLHSLVDSYEGDLEEAAWRGCLVAFGAYAFALVLDQVFHGLGAFTKAAPAKLTDDEVAALEGVVMDDETKRRDINYSRSNRDGKPGHRNVTDLANLAPTVWNISIADFIHNAVDGMAIATAFLACNASLGWSVTLSILFHEIPQEISDFFVLLKGGMTVLQAGLINLMSALAALLGGIIILIIGADISPKGQAYLLMASAGLFLNVGATDLLPKVFLMPSENGWPQIKKRALLLGCFALGATVIGLTLLSDIHCEAGGHAHGHSDDHGDEHGSDDHGSDDHGSDDHSEE
ncbi:unnamed protein product [Chrysoparadoxa australica]